MAFQYRAGGFFRSRRARPLGHHRHPSSIPVTPSGPRRCRLSILSHERTELRDGTLSPPLMGNSPCLPRPREAVALKHLIASDAGIVGLRFTFPWAALFSRSLNFNAVGALLPAQPSVQQRAVRGCDLMEVLPWIDDHSSPPSSAVSQPRASAGSPLLQPRSPPCRAIRMRSPRTRPRRSTPRRRISASIIMAAGAIIAARGIITAAIIIAGTITAGVIAVLTAGPVRARSGRIRQTRDERATCLPVLPIARPACEGLGISQPVFDPTWTGNGLVFSV